MGLESETSLPKSTVYYRDLREEVIGKYGGVCVCGMSDLAVLTIDHINDDGPKDRAGLKRSFKEQRGGYRVFSFYLQLKREPKRSDLQVLCYNCQLRKLRRLIMRPEYTLSTTGKYNRKLRENVLDGYGARCSECNEDDREVLVVDHVGGGGTEERHANKDVTNRKALVDARQRNYPPDYRILCANCNTLDAKTRLH